MSIRRDISCISRGAGKLHILAWTAGISFHSRNLVSEPRSIACIYELYCHMSVLAEAEKGTLETKDRESKQQYQHENSQRLFQI